MIEFDPEDYFAPFKYTFNKGRFKGSSYYVKSRICSSPLCQCNEMLLHFYTSKDNDLMENGEPAFNVNLNIIEPSLVGHTNIETSKKFSKAFLHDLDESDLTNLYGLYYETKYQITQETDLTTLDIEFPYEEIEEDSQLIQYNEFIPYDLPILLQLEDSLYFAEDLYCVHPECNCKDVHLLFKLTFDFPPPVDPPEDLDITYIILNWKTKKWSVEEKGNLAATPKELMSSLFQEYEGCKIFRTRHQTMRQLYKNSREDYYFPLEDSYEDFLIEKVGRNEPCPCGSGKKYKKCCLDKNNQ